MELSTGTRLGPYEIIARVGAGGMGEVYKAHDTRLGRAVAIKVLAARIRDDDAVRKRFLREARAISALNHPHICSLYDIGRENGNEFLVMEYLEGETLAELLARDRIPFSDAIRYALEIAEALERAHRQGIVHRDLKPGNVMITKSGAKLLDFGLARVLETESSLSAPLTADDAMIGTVEYMAPEQLQGGTVDARADIFAFGVLLYEMFTGVRPFSGHNRASVIGAILFADPAPAVERDASLSSQLDRLIRTCLAKDPEERIQTAHDVRLQLEWIRDGVTGNSGVFRRPRFLRRTVSTLWIALAAVAGAAVGGLWIHHLDVPAKHEVRFEMTSPVAGEQIDWPAISPDGTKIAFVSESSVGGRSLWVRELRSGTVRKIASPDDVKQLFWEPGGSSIAFFVGNKMEAFSFSDSRTQTLATADSPRGGTWNDKGTLLYAPHVGDGLWATTIAASVPRRITTLDRSRQDSSHRWPEFLPDGDHFLFVIRSSNLQRSGLYAGSLSDAHLLKKISTIQTHALVTSDGWLLFTDDRKLFRQRFDLRSLVLSGAASVVADGIEPDLKVTGATRISASRDGTIVFSSPLDRRSHLAWLDANGKLIRTLTTDDYYVNPALSPDQKTIAVSRINPRSGLNSIWLVNAQSGALSPLVDDDSDADEPIWSADGRNIYYMSDRRGSYEVYERAIGQVASDRLVFASHTYAQPIADARTGLLLRVAEREKTAAYFFWRTGEPSPKLLMRNDTGGVADLTRDGRWLVAMGMRNDSHAYNLFLQSIDDPSRVLQVTARGAEQPTWRPDGKEFYYISVDGDVTATPFRDGQLGASRTLFRLPGVDPFYSAHDYCPNFNGSRFAVLQHPTNIRVSTATIIVQK